MRKLHFPQHLIQNYCTYIYTTSYSIYCFGESSAWLADEKERYAVGYVPHKETLPTTGTEHIHNIIPNIYLKGLTRIHVSLSNTELADKRHIYSQHSGTGAKPPTQCSIYGSQLERIHYIKSNRCECWTRTEVLTIHSHHSFNWKNTFQRQTNWME